MPIRPENLARYPADWRQIRLRILARAEHRCEHPGCAAQQYDAGYWGRWAGQDTPVWFRLSEHANYAEAKQAASEHSFARFGDGPVPNGASPVIVIVLTIAHLDHTPENCGDDNLRAWCQRHHLAYDAVQHAATRAATRRATARTLDMFAEA